MNLKEHWNHVYQTKEHDDVSWYQISPCDLAQAHRGIAEWVLGGRRDYPVEYRLSGARDRGASPTRTASRRRLTQACNAGPLEPH
jgi:hypothetical protein